MGTVEEVTPDGRAIVRCEDLPEMGDAVFDSHQRKIGTVGRIFGPVSEPYASVTPCQGCETSGLKKSILFYTKGKRHNGKNKGRNRRNRSLPGMRQPSPHP
ncbi:MAG: hypothetical protein IKD00_03515 [Candidatus Methanomethylophilaceae archaeon]|nr:hypothetical protein [Candidatus Methanomethylophilaceae archaeon]